MVPAIRVENLSKSYRLDALGQQHGGYRTLRDSLVELAKSPLRRLGVRRRGGVAYEDFWALKDINLEVRSGEVVGIIGRNGAGKSTLLKILSRITKPTTGRVELRGRVGSLLEVGTGFHPELSGRENVFLNGSILGMSRKEINRQFDAIVDFSGVERFIDTPVKRYSSGMHVRLAFAVAAHLNPEILLIDEVLAVGDAEFQRRCVTKMGEVARSGRTVLFVSHNMAAVEAICGSAYLISNGLLECSGETSRVISRYLQGNDELCAMTVENRVDRSGSGRVRFRSVVVRDARGAPVGYVSTGQDACIEVQFTVLKSTPPAGPPIDFAIIVRDQNGALVTTLSSHFTGDSLRNLADGEVVTCRVSRLPLTSGSYRFDLWCGVSDETEDLLLDAAKIEIRQGDYYRAGGDLRLPNGERHGRCLIPYRWSRGAHSQSPQGESGDQREVSNAN